MGNETLIKIQAELQKMLEKAQEDYDFEKRYAIEHLEQCSTGLMMEYGGAGAITRTDLLTKAAAEVQTIKQIMHMVEHHKNT